MKQPHLTQFPELWKALCDLPENILNYSGRFLYGDISTLRKGNYYLLGYNPGGDPLKETKTLKEDIDAWGGKSFIEVWPSCFQPNMEALSKVIAPRKFCWSNLYFERSKESWLMRETNPEIYWPVHKEVLNIVKPSCVFAVGVSKAPTYKIIKNLLFPFRQVKETSIFPFGYSDWKCRVAEGQYQGRPLKLIGLPSLSYGYIGQDALKKIAEECSCLA